MVGMYTQCTSLLEIFTSTFGYNSLGKIGLRLFKNRNKLAGKRLLGFLPTVAVRTAFRGSVHVQRYKRLISRLSLAFVVQQLLDLAPKFMYNFEIVRDSGMISYFIVHIILMHVVVIQGVRYDCHVRVPFFIADEMDLSKTINGFFASSQANRPCNLCNCIFSEDMTVLGEPRDYIALRQVSFDMRLGIKC